jgi:hypothetical protein
MEYKYKIASTKNSSEKYGNCEVCKKSVPEVFIQTEVRHYKTDDSGQKRWTFHGCRDSLFGHKECLAKVRKGGTVLSKYVNKYEQEIFMLNIQ